MSKNSEHDKEIAIFQEYLRIPSVHPNIDYEPCLIFLRKQAEDLNLPHKTIIVKDSKKPILLMTWKGTNPELPAILLNSHMDVVPVFEENWIYPPFGAEIHDGKIYARGSQDMKCVGTQYLGAIRALKKSGFQPKRTFHLTFVPEEEIGGVDGMQDFVHIDEFKELNVGFAMDESIGSFEDTFNVFYAERALWHVNFIINGKPGHGLQLFQGTVGEKATYLMNKLNEFRQTQIELIKGKPTSLLATVTTVNLTKLNGGVQSNVIPPQITLTYDMRLAVDMNHDQWEQQLKSWCEEAGGDIEINFQVKNLPVPPTKLDSSNKFWLAFKKAINKLDEKVTPCACPGATDIRFVRSLGIPSIGFMPINNTPVLLHDHDEYLSVETYLRGIKIYEEIIMNLANLD